MEPSGTSEEIVYTNKSSPSPRLVTGEERENGVVSKNVTLIDTKLLDIVQSFPLLSYCIVSPMSVYI